MSLEDNVLGVRYSNYTGLCNTLASPLLRNMLATEVKVTMDKNYNIVIPLLEGVTIEHFEVYVNYCNTGTINHEDDFNVNLFIYMGHVIREDDIEYSKVRLMEYWYGKCVLTSDSGKCVLTSDMNGLYTNNEVDKRPLGLMYVMMKDLDYCYTCRYNRLFTFGILNVDDMKTFFTRYYEFEEQEIVFVKSRLAWSISDSIRTLLYERQDLLDIIDDKNSTILDKIEILQAVNVDERLILSLVETMTITTDKYEHEIVFVPSLSEFTHRHYIGGDSSVLVYNRKKYGSFVTDYMNDGYYTYADNVYSDIVIETIDDNGNLIIEWDEPIPSVLSAKDEVYQIPLNMRIKDRVLHVSDDSKLSSHTIDFHGYDTAEMERELERDRREAVGVEEEEIISYHEKTILVLWYAGLCDKIIIHNVME